MALEIVDIWNQAFRAAGLPLRANEAFEGSEQARTALELYGQCRDALLDAKQWTFSRKVLALALLKGPPPANGYNFAQPWSNIYPQPGFLYEYSYPDDCLTLRAIIQQPGGMPDLDPLPAIWRIDNDPTPVVSGNPLAASGPAQKVILCNITDAIAVYTARITDPALWSDAGFVEALVETLGKKFAVAFGQSPQQVAMTAAEAAKAEAVGVEDRG